MPQLIAASSFLTKCARTLSIPVICTEQVPFLRTVAEIDLTGIEVIKKSQFSMLVDPVTATLRARPAITNVFIYGLEAHVCVLQSVLDLVRGGYNVFLVVDAVFSQNNIDRDAAIERMRGLGAQVTTAESAIYELLHDARHPRFKDVLTHVKEYATVKSKL